MRKLAFSFYLLLTLIYDTGKCQGLQLTATNTIYTIDFDNTVAGVNNGAFNGVNINPAPASGELNSNGWTIAPFSFPNGAAVFGTTSTSGGGVSTGNVSAETYYAFEPSTGNRAVGFNLTTFNSGFSNTLRVQNNTGTTMTTLALNYKVYINNNSDGATYFSFGYSTDNISYFSEQDDTLTATADVSPTWKAYLRSYLINGLSVPNGGYIYLKWIGMSYTGDPEGDEIAWDDIAMVANPTTVFPGVSGNFENIHASGPILLSGNATIAGDIILYNQYNIELGNFNLTVGGLIYKNSSGYIRTNGTGSVIITNVTAARLIPIGSSTYNPLIIGNGSGLDWSARVSDGISNASNTDRAVLRTWTITPSTNPPPAGANITFQYNDGDPTQIGANFNTSEDVQVWHDDGLGWTTASGGLTPTGTPGGIRTVTLTNWTDFSAFAISNVSGALPVKFGAVKALRDPAGVKVKWTNYTETNILYYNIERSTDARTFTSIGRTNPVLNNGNAAEYSTIDPAPFSGNNFYRIAAVETNGNIVYSMVVRINLDKSTPGILVFPNPAQSSNAYLQLTGIAKGTYEIKIFSSNAQLVKRKTLSHDGGSLVVPLDVPVSLKPGLYLIQVFNKDVLLQNKFILE